MARGETTQLKVHYKGEHDDYIIFLEGLEPYQKWQADKSYPLTRVVSAFKIFVTHRQGAQGSYDAASNAALENEFGTHNEDEVIKQLLEKGVLHQSQFPERQGSRNEAQGDKIGY